jgi:hypothetical protein
MLAVPSVALSVSSSCCWPMGPRRSLYCRPYLQQQQYKQQQYKQQQYKRQRRQQQ